MNRSLTSRILPRILGGSGMCLATPIAAGRLYRYCTSINVPTIAESVTSGRIQSWLKHVGDSVEEDEVICNLESDKANVEIRAPKNGTLIKFFFEEGDIVNVGEKIADMKEGEVAPKKTAEVEDKGTSKKPESGEALMMKTETSVLPKEKPTAAKKEAPVGFVAGSDPRSRSVRVSVIRQRIADRLKASQNTAAMLTTFNEVDMTNLIEIREKYKDSFLKKHDVKLGFMSPFTKACAIALQDIPIVNASWGNDVIEYHDYVDISVAVATPNGLVVPVIRDVQNMNLAQIEKKIEDFGKRARMNKITVPEMTGGTFTISNGGVFGSWMGTPIINPPQSAILGMHSVKKKPWVVNNQIVIRDIMALALTYDHRIVDGKDAVQFLVKIKSLIEDPVRIVLDLA